MVVVGMQFLVEVMEEVLALEEEGVTLPALEEGEVILQALEVVEVTLQALEEHEIVILLALEVEMVILLALEVEVVVTLLLHEVGEEVMEGIVRERRDPALVEFSRDLKEMFIQQPQMKAHLLMKHPLNICRLEPLQGLIPMVMMPQ